MPPTNVIPLEKLGFFSARKETLPTVHYLIHKSAVYLYDRPELIPILFFSYGIGPFPIFLSFRQNLYEFLLYNISYCGSATLSRYSDSLRPGRSGFRITVGRDFLHQSRLSMGPTQSPMQWVRCHSRG